jgi:membrane protease YdiL (CAAX protease family)
MERNVGMNISTPNDPYLATVSAVAARTTPVARFAPDLGWRSTWVGRHRVGVFLVLAFALSWWAWPLAVRNPASSPQVSFGPMIAAFSVAALAGGRHQVVRLLRAVVHWRVPLSRYVIAVAGPFLITGIVAVSAIAFGVIDPAPVSDAFGWSSWSAVPLLFVMTALLGGPLFEEVGWRGFLLDELQRRRPVVVSTLAVALVWAAWHLPLLISEPTGQRPPLPFVVWILGQAFVLTWIYNTSAGSVLLAILFHTAVNVSTRLLLEPFAGQPGFLGVWWLLAAAYALLAFVLLGATRSRLGIGPATSRGAAADRTATS